MSSVAPGDKDRVHSDVTLGSRWFIWNFHQTVTKERYEHGVRMVLLRPDGYRARKGIHLPWVAAWRVQKFGFLHAPVAEAKATKGQLVTAGIKLTPRAEATVKKVVAKRKPKAQPKEKVKVNLRGRPRKGETIPQARARRLAAAEAGK